MHYKQSHYTILSIKLAINYIITITLNLFMFNRRKLLLKRAPKLSEVQAIIAKEYGNVVTTFRLRAKAQANPPLPPPRNPIT